MADEKLIKSSDLQKARELDFTLRFNNNIKKLIEVLGVTRKIAKEEGTTLSYYKTTGTLESGEVPEGDIIPLSKYATEKVAVKDLVLKKWRKATTIEAIVQKGYDQAVNDTDDKMLYDAQTGIKTSLFNTLATGKGTAKGATFQAALAQAWGQLQVLFEDNDISSVYMMNPLDVADYLATAPITLQTVFGMNYVENFLGLGTVLFNAAVPKGKIYATAKENLVMYYIPTNGAGIGQAFSFTSDETGLIGIHENADYTNDTYATNVVSGVEFFVEKIDGVVISDITGIGA